MAKIVNAERLKAGLADRWSPESASEQRGADRHPVRRLKDKGVGVDGGLGKHGELIADERRHRNRPHGGTSGILCNSAIFGASDFWPRTKG